jgi:hypothetical protein
MNILINMESETQIEQFVRWKKLILGNCPAILKSSSGVPFCQLEGNSCCFKFCPRRFYIDAEHGKEGKDLSVPIVAPAIQT